MARPPHSREIETAINVHALKMYRRSTMGVIFLISTLTLAAALISPVHAVDYAVKDNTGNSGGGALFRNEIGTGNAGQTLVSATDFIWRTFQQTSPSDRKSVQSITLIMENTNGVAYTSNNEIHFNANYIENYKGDRRREFAGVIYHEVTHVLQWNGNGRAPGGLIEGVADFIRLKAGYAPAHWVRPGQGDRWDQGYDVTARFLDYCNDLRRGFVAELNKKMRGGYSDGFFVELLGKTVDQLWKEYKAKYGR